MSVPRSLRRLLRAVAAGIDAEGCYRDDQDGARTTLRPEDIPKLEALAELGYITEGLTLTDLGREAMLEYTPPPEPKPVPKDRKTCPSSKVRYTTEKAALSWLSQHRTRAQKGAPKGRAYACPWCDGWHITKKKTWKKGKIKGSWS